MACRLPALLQRTCWTWAAPNDWDDWDDGGFFGRLTLFCMLETYEI